MQPQVLEPRALQMFLASVKEEFELVGPVSREGGQHSFQVIADLEDLVLDYVHTILPPKKYLLPQREVLMAFKLGQDVAASAVNEAKSRVIVGVHPCDLSGIRHLDHCFIRESEDWNYRAKRAGALIIGTECLPDDHCFCGSVGSMRPGTEGYDLFLTDLGDHWLMTIGTEAGADLLQRHAPPMRNANAADIKDQEGHYRRKKSMQKAKLHADIHDLPLIFEGAYKDAVWDKYAEQCLGCGTCTNVCPTCYCFDIDDDVKITLDDGTRKRVWDSCQLREFTEVAGGENFRDKLSLRVRHRVYRKFHYLHRRFNEPNCTGCGRCGRQCVAGIRMDAVVNDLVASVLGASMSGGSK